MTNVQDDGGQGGHSAVGHRPYYSGAVKPERCHASGVLSLAPLSN